MGHFRAFALAAAIALGASACAPRAGEAVGGEHASAEAGAEHPGKAVYDQWCASCHDNGGQSGAPSFEALRTLPRATVKYALELGYMKIQAKDVPKPELAQLIEWLPKDEGSVDSWISAARCPVKMREVKLNDDQPRVSTTFGVTSDGNRAQSAKATGLSRDQMKDLEVAWVAAFPQTPTMRSQPVIVGDTIFIATTDAGRLYALDTNSGCVKWHYVSDMTLRSSLTFAEATDKLPAAILMGDAAGFVHAVDARTGKKLWVSEARLNDLNRITGAPMVHDGKVFTPVSAIEVNYAGQDDYECCKGQGAIVTFDLATGKKLWTGTTMEPAQPVRLGRTGTQQWGPSGAIIWATPVIDAKRNVIYAGTGENTSWPATDTSDAIIAYDMDTGEKRWVFQATKADIWNYACGRRSANCDWPGEYHSPDHDFGATSMLIKRSDGSELVIAGQKSGVVWALNPDNGALVWSNKVGRGSANGGVHWGMAFDGTRVFVPNNDSNRPAGPDENPAWGPGIHAVNAMSGEIEWSYKNNLRDCGQEAPVAKAYVPSDPWKIQRVTAPILPPPPRVTQAPVAPRPPAAAVGAPATAPSGATAGAAGAAAAPVAAAAPAPARPAVCRLGMSPAPLLVDGAVVTGTTQGMLRIFDGKTGDVLFEYMTNRDFPNTVNGVEGHGGGLDSAPYVAGDGTLFVQSGYARFGEPPGNVLIAFRPKKR
jgi:polyvinyl alcohol dehydrogenase (cytochrome)